MPPAGVGKVIECAGWLRAGAVDCHRNWVAAAASEDAAAFHPILILICMYQLQLLMFDSFAFIWFACSCLCCHTAGISSILCGKQLEIVSGCVNGGKGGGWCVWKCFMLMNMHVLALNCILVSRVSHFDGRACRSTWHSAHQCQQLLFRELLFTTSITMSEQ